MQNKPQIDLNLSKRLVSQTSKGRNTHPPKGHGLVFPFEDVSKVENRKKKKKNQKSEKEEPTTIEKNKQESSPQRAK